MQVPGERGNLVKYWCKTIRSHNNSAISLRAERPIAPCYWCPCLQILCFLLLDYPGLRVDDAGRIIPHSILGSVVDFVEQAVKIGDEAVSHIYGH